MFRERGQEGTGSKGIIRGVTQKFRKEEGDCKNNLGSNRNYSGEEQEKNSGSQEMRA